MARMDYQRAAAEQRTKKSLIAAAAADGPTAITSKFDGTCTTCKRGFRAGARISRTWTGWEHATCTGTAPDAQTRLAARRARLRATKT